MLVMWKTTLPSAGGRRISKPSLIELGHLHRSDFQCRLRGPLGYHYSRLR